VSATVGDFGEMPPAVLLAHRPDLLGNAAFRKYAAAKGMKLPPSGGAGIGPGGRQHIPASLKHKGHKPRKPKRPVKLGSGGAGLPTVPPSSQIGAAGIPFSTSDLDPIRKLVARVLADDGGSSQSGTGLGIGVEGTAGQMADLISYYTGLWSGGGTGGAEAIPPPTVGPPNPSADTFANWADPSAFVISADQWGNPVTPYISPNVTPVGNELAQLIGYQGSMVSAMSDALAASQALGPKIAAAITRRKRMIDRVRDRIRKNIERIKKLREEIAHVQKKLKHDIAVLQKKPLPYPHPKNSTQDAANKAFTTARTEQIKDLNQDAVKEIKGLNRRIAALEKDNRVLGGQPDSLPSLANAGGELGALFGQLGSPASGGTLAVAEGTSQGASGGLYALQANAQGWVQALNGSGPLAGLGGSLQTEQTQLAVYKQALAALAPQAAADLKNAQSQAQSQSSSQSNSQLVSLLEQQLAQQGEALAVSQLQYQALAQGLPPFAGVFHEGGMVPGPVGAERLILAQGGEVITPLSRAGGGRPPEVHLHIADGMGWLKRFVSAEVHQYGRVTGRRAASGMPGRAGQLVQIPQIRR
jgi:hypothetical protein